MNKKTLLIGLTTCSLMIATLTVAVSNQRPIDTFAENNPSSNYTAVIDKDNRLKPGTSSGWFGIQLHGSEEYGFFNVSAPSWININPTDEYSDYAFSWENSDGSSKFFSVDLYELPESSYYTERIDGKDRYLRGFPGAYRITTVFYNPGNITFDDSEPLNEAGWGFERTYDEGTKLTTDVTTWVGPEKPDKNQMVWCSRQEGTIYIKSITIEYTCG